MFSDVSPCGTTSKLKFYIDLMYHALGHAKDMPVMCGGLPVTCKGLPVMCGGLPVMHEGLPVMHPDWNHDSHMITMTSQCECDDVIHAM